MRQLTLAGLRLCLAGGPDRDGGGDGLMVVLLHGFGAPGTDLVGLHRQLRVPDSVRFVFPQGPLAVELGPDARAWWMVDLIQLQAALLSGQTRDLSQSVPEGLLEARASLVALLDTLERDFDVLPGRLLLGGFSQGAMLACDVALRDERPLAGLALMSGTLIADFEWAPLMARRRGLRVVQSHGRADPLLPFALAERLRDALSAAGLDVTFVPFNGGHTITDSVLDALSELICRASATA
jgi:phospholipase/carboxylesterase